MVTRNRILELLKPGATLNGLDFVEVREAEPTHLYVHFLNTVAVASPQFTASITGGDITPTVPVDSINPADWSVDSEGRPVLLLRVPGRGDHSTYTLTVDKAPAVDPYFQSIEFSFFVFCPSLVDCRKPDDNCPEGDDPLPAIDYLAKDYNSFRQALSDFSLQRYPEWRERAEADFGMVVLEALSGIGDELSYIQDQTHLQARIDTATERRSIVRLARLVDYEPRPTVSASTTLQCNVATSSLPAGIRVNALAPDGSTIPFEIGTGIRDNTNYQVSPLWNAGIQPYWWDDAVRCLAPGTTAMYVLGQGFGFFKGQTLLIDTAGPTSADPPVRQLVRLTQIDEVTDPLFAQQITRLTWQADDQLTAHHDLTRTVIAGNLVPATQGIRRSDAFAIAKAPVANPAMPLAVARLGPDSTASTPEWEYRWTISSQPLAYLPTADGTLRPEIVLTRVGPEPQDWPWVKSLLEAGEFERKFTIDPEAYRAVANLPSGICYDYDGSEGATIRFGNGVFGLEPADDDVFEVRHRESQGAAGCVPAGAITGVDAAWAGILISVTNPFAAEGGQAAETDEQVRQRAPEAFRATTFRAVRPEDYNKQAMRLAWVQRAGAVFRWTGSWTTIFVVTDPKNADAISPAEHSELSQLLNRVRLAGYEVYAPAPVYVSFDLKIHVCAAPNAFRGDVITGIESALRPVRYSDDRVGFFHFDNFTLGTPFERSRLEAAIQEVSGVAGVLSIEYRRRGLSSGFSILPPLVTFGPQEVFRMDNDANHPERGSYVLDVLGGK
jgi:Baseplate J-like protein